MKKIFPTRKKGISFLSKKWILAICLVSIAGNTPATQPPKSGGIRCLQRTYGYPMVVDGTNIDH